MSDALKTQRPGKKPADAPDPARAHGLAAPTAPEPAAEAAAVPAWSSGTAAAPFALGAPPVQRKPVIGRADDAYEREADAVADRVAARGVVSPAGISRVSAAALGPVQRKSPGDVSAHDADQRQVDRLQEEQKQPALPVQRKEAGEDDGKQEAPGAAPDVQTKPLVQRKAAEGEDETKESPDAAIQRKEIEGEGEKKDEEPAPAAPTSAPEPSAAAPVQRKEMDGGEEKKDETSAEPVQTKPVGAGGGGSPAMRSAAATAISTRGPGSPLPAPTRGTLEAGMGVDLGGVRVHTGPSAETAASALNARAFTHGRDIWLGRGESTADTKLMAHETTHVLQQDGVVRRAPAVAPARQAAEEDEEEERRRREKRTNGDARSGAQPGEGKKDDDEKEEEKKEKGEGPERAKGEEKETGEEQEKEAPAGRAGEARRDSRDRARPSFGSPRALRVPFPVAGARAGAAGGKQDAAKKPDAATPAASAAGLAGGASPAATGAAPKAPGTAAPGAAAGAAGATPTTPGAAPATAGTFALAGGATAGVTGAGAAKPAAATALAGGASAGVAGAGATKPGTAAPAGGASAGVAGAAPKSPGATAPAGGAPAGAAEADATKPGAAPAGAAAASATGAAGAPKAPGTAAPGAPGASGAVPGAAGAAGAEGAAGAATAGPEGAADAKGEAPAEAKDKASKAAAPGGDAAGAAGEGGAAPAGLEGGPAAAAGGGGAAGMAAGPESADGGGGGAAPTAEGGGDAEAGPGEDASAADTEAKMAGAQPEADRAAEAGAEAEVEQAEAQGESVPEPSVGGGAAEAAGGGGAAVAEEEEEEEAAAPEAGAPEPAAAPAAGAVDAAAEVSPEAGAAAGAEAAAEPGPAADAGAMGEELPASEKQAGLSSIGEAGGGAEYSGGGGGGGGTVPDAPEPAAPAVPANDPESAMAAVASLPPVKLAASLSQVSAAASANVGEQKQALAAAPPQMERPSGSPVTRSAPASLAAPAADGAKKVEKAPEGAAVQTPEPAPLPAPGPTPTQAVVTPEEPADVAAGLRRLPTADPGLEADAGTPPKVQLEGNADPARAHEQHAELQAGLADAETRGRADLAQPMGEDEIYPVVPRETLKATVPAGGPASGGGAGGGGPAAAGGGGGGGGGESEDAVSIIAQEKSGPEIRAAASAAQGEMAARRQEHTQKDAEEREKSQAEIARVEADNAGQQTAARAEAKGQSQAAREEWSGEQQTLSADARAEADTAVADGETEVAAERESADTQAAAEIDTGNQEAARHRQEGEDKAASERRRGEQEADSGGVFGWLKSKAKAFFDGIKKGIQAAFEAARKAVKAAIEAAKKAAVALIEKARQAIVAAIKKVGDALIAIGDRLLAGFPGLRDRFRAKIKGFVEAAEKKVNELADQLKKDVVAALDALGSALDAALGLLEKGLLAAVDAVNKVVNAAIDAAKAVADAIGTFLSLVKDVASGPGQWLSNLGSAIVDGIKNHLWKAFKTEVKNWFNQKLEAVLGVGTAIWEVLSKGGISLAQVGQMAFEALKAAIPGALVQILIEKLVAMIVPAAGAVMAIIEGLQAAWGAVSSILTAISRFITFLKAVKGGNAGPQFASALAAGAVAVIDFVASWLLRKLMKAGKAVGGRVKAIAQRIMARIKKVLKKVAAKVKKAVKKIGKAIKKGVAKLKKKFGKGKKGKGKGKGKDKKKKDKDKKNRDKLDRAKRELTPKVHALLSRGSRGVIFWARMRAWQFQYGLKSLSAKGGQVVATVNPSATLSAIIDLHKEELVEYMRGLGKRLIQSPKAQKDAGEILGSVKQVPSPVEKPKAGRETVPEYTVKPSHGFPGAMAAMEQRGAMPMWGIEQTHFEGASAATVARMQSWGRSNKNMIVKTLSGGRMVGKRGKYVQHAEDLAAMGNSATVSKGIQGWLKDRSKPLPPGVNANQIAALVTIMGGQEQLRSGASLPNMVMALQVAEKQGWDKALGAFPMSPEDAVRQSKALDKSLDLKNQRKKWKEGDAPLPTLSKQEESDAKAAMEREIALLKLWIDTLDLKFDSKGNEITTLNRLKKEIYQRMIKALRKK